MDMIGYSSKYFGVTLEGTNTKACLDLMELAEDNFLEVAPKLDRRTTTVSFGSDHVPFQQAGSACAATPIVLACVLPVHCLCTCVCTYHCQCYVLFRAPAPVCVIACACACVCRMRGRERERDRVRVCV